MKSTRAMMVVFAGVSLAQAVGTAHNAGHAATGVASRTEADISANARWAEAAFGDGADPAAAGNRLTTVHEDVAGDTKVGRCAFGTPVRLGEKTYSRGIGVNSRCVLRLMLAQPAARFVADIGLDRNVDHTAASVTMHVRVDGKDRFQTPVLRPDGKVHAIDVPLSGAKSLDLVVNDGGDGRGWDQADWADARVILQDGTQLWLDDLARQALPAPGVPFTFVYGGQPSTEILPEWRRQVSTERLDATRTRRILTLTDPKTQLEVRSVATVYTDTPGVDWTLCFTNRGEQETPLLEQVRAVEVSVSLGPGATPLIHRLRGSRCAADDWMPFDEALPPGKRIEFGAVNGRSSADSPFFNVDWGSGGVVTAVGWSGQWRGAVEHRSGAEVGIQAGMEHLRLSLRPGESIRSPRVMQLYWSGGDQYRAYILFRQTMLAHVVPKHGGRTVTPPIVHLSTSFYEMNDSTEANVLSHLEAVEGLGFEMFWLDAYWTRGGFPAGMGNYGFPLERVEPRDRFPRGIQPIRDAVHQAGLKYLMWFEPERVHPGTAIAEEHPQWVISPGGDGGGLFNLGIPEAREFMTRYLKAAIKEYGLDCLRIDFNIDPLPFWEFLNQQAPERVGIAEIRYIEGLYRMWDDLRAAYPRLLIDNCASGGRRIDLETCSRALPLWRSDNTCDMVGADLGRIAHAAIKNQVMSQGLNRYVPFSTVGQMGSTPYQFRSGFNGGIAFAEDCRGADYPRDQLREAIAEGKRIRPYWLGNSYPLSEPTLDPAAWCVMQYHRQTESDGILLCFRRERSPYASFDCELREIDPAADYEVTLSAGYQPSSPVTIRGEELLRYRAVIDERPGSLILEYRSTAPQREK
ncbi:MAG: NPCBM/NEW2 domain-containing protein [Phycisphaerae bacterium]|nr:NPCBM/NEW2 domain-containing protein [Phycisphaerae bacterium]